VLRRAQQWRGCWGPGRAGWAPGSDLSRLTTAFRGGVGAIQTGNILLLVPR